jgi:outer membrane protein assembly factor BamB
MIKQIITACVMMQGLAGAAVAGDVLTYHNTRNHHGAYTVPGLTLAAAATIRPYTGFSATVSGNVYAQPLFWKPKGSPGELIVATESNIVYALNATTGAVIWHTQLAPPVPLKSLPCGNIDPEGVTGTPVIDPKTGTLYLNALALPNGNIRQLLYAISLKDGTVQANWPIDVQAQLATKSISFASTNQGERSAMLFSNGLLYTVYGGKAGDCLPYRGTVIETDPVTRAFTGVWQTRASGGGIWSQGGIATDAKSLYVTTGNTFGASTYGDGESIVRLKPGLAHSTATTDFYAPANWQSLDNGDTDLGGSEALPVNLAVAGGGAPARRMFALGKDGKAYLVNRGNLGGIGGAATVVQVANSAIITGPAVYSTTTLDMVAFQNNNPVGCSGAGIMMLALKPTGTAPITTAWCAHYNGNGSPIITTTDGTTYPIVWVAGAEGDNQLHGFNALTGAAVFSGSGTTMTGLHHFQTVLAADGHLYVAGDGKVFGFMFTPG